MPSIPFRLFTRELLGLYASGRAKKTHGKMKQVLDLVAGLDGVESTSDLIPELVARFVAGPCAGKHPNTTAGLLSYLRRACAYAEDRGYLKKSPFRLWRGYVRTLPAAEPRWHSREAIRRVLVGLAARRDSRDGHRLFAWAGLLAMTGLRRDESLYLSRRDVVLDAAGKGSGLILIRSKAQRHLKRPTTQRTVPICAALGPILAGWLARPDHGSAEWVFPNQGGSAPWRGGSSGRRPTDRLKAAGEAVGVAGLTAESLRHSFATHAATAWRLPPLALQAIMGHSSLKITMRYYVHADAANLVALVASVGYDAA